MSIFGRKKNSAFSEEDSVSSQDDSNKNDDDFDDIEI